MFLLYSAHTLFPWCQVEILFMERLTIENDKFLSCGSLVYLRSYTCLMEKWQISSRCWRDVKLCATLVLFRSMLMQHFAVFIIMPNPNSLFVGQRMEKRTKNDGELCKIDGLLWNALMVLALFDMMPFRGWIEGGYRCKDHDDDEYVFVVFLECFILLRETDRPTTYTIAPLPLYYFMTTKIVIRRFCS